MEFTETTKLVDEDGRSTIVERVFEIDTTPEILREEFAQFVPQMAIDNNFKTKARQFARTKLYEWRVSNGYQIGDCVHDQVLEIINGIDNA